MFGCDSLFGAVLLLVILIWKGLEKLGKGINSLGSEKMTEEEIIEFQRKCLERDREFIEELNKMSKH